MTDPRERLEKFGQDDHVRRYGPDFADRLRAAGGIVGVGDMVSKEDAVRLGLGPESGDIYFCKKA